MPNKNIKQLKGQELLKTARALNNSTRREMAIDCGYSETNSNGEEIVDLDGFYEALLSANENEIRLTASNNPTESADERAIHIVKDGEAIVRLPFSLKKTQYCRLNVESEKWDDYYPGSPVVISLTSTESHEDIKEESTAEITAFNPDGSLSIKSPIFLRGNRYCLEIEEDDALEIDNFTFRLEPEPWNGLEASIKEDLRLLTLPEDSIRDLLSLCHDEQENLFDPDQHDTFEEHLASSLKQAIANLDTEEAEEHFAVYGLSSREGKELATRNWSLQTLLDNAPEVKKVVGELID